MPSPIRIAFVAQDHNNTSGRLLRGMSRFSRDRPGSDEPRYLLREFLSPFGSKQLPDGFEAWSPDAVCCALSVTQRPVFEQFKVGGRPVVHLFGIGDPQGDVVVVSDAMDGYSMVHDHFDQMGVERRALVCMIDEAGKRGSKRYRAFCEQRGIRFDMLMFEDENEDFNHPGPLRRWPKALADWLIDLPKPAGIFTVNSFIGPYLARIAKQLGIAVPDELAIIGVDGFDVSLWSDPPLTSVHFPLEQVGTEAVRVALQMLDGWTPPDHPIRITGAQVVARGSTVSRQTKGVDIPAAIRFIDEFTFENITTDTVTALSQNVSSKTFTKQFKAWTGMTPAQAIRAKKLDEAKHLLRDTDISITALALACGYCDDVEFRKVFNKVEGCSPSVYRAERRV